MLMRTPARVARQAQQRGAGIASFSAPVAGWISNRALAIPNDGPQGAALIPNFFPTPIGAILRRGRRLHAQADPDMGPVLSLMKYVVGVNQKLFAASSHKIFDITTVDHPIGYEIGAQLYTLGEPDDDYGLGEQALVGADVWQEGGNWFAVQFATTGGIFLIGVNGATTGFIFDGSAFYPNVPGGVWSLGYDAEVAPFEVGETITGGTSGATAVIWKVEANRLILTEVASGPFQDDETITGSEGGEATANAPDGEETVVPGVTFPGGLTTADMAFVFVFKSTLWFIQKDSLDAWYLPIDQIGGTAKKFPFAGIFNLGGSLMIGQAWSMATSGQGGLSEQCVFVTTEGEVAVYQGTHPDVDGEWVKAGTYRIGAPLGRRGWIRSGGDLLFATTIGFIPLSTAIQVDLAALSPRAISIAIADAWNEAVQLRGREWACMLWPEGQMVAVAPPAGDSEPIFLVSNAQTGAWAPFTNWNATCMEVFDGRLFFGTPDGGVMEAMVGGTDNGIPFTGTYAPLFTDDGKPSAYKIARLARAEIKSAVPVNEQLSCRFDFDDSLPPPPDVEPVPVGNEWDNAIWNESIWSSASKSIVSKRRHSVWGDGYRFSPIFQVTSGTPVPLDVQIVSLDITYDAGDIFT